jgi:hypothetical protein
MVKPDTGEKIEIFVGGEDEPVTSSHPIIKTKTTRTSACCLNNARIYDLNYNATISGDLYSRHFTILVKERKASSKSTRPTSPPFPDHVAFPIQSWAYHTNADLCFMNNCTTKADIS